LESFGKEKDEARKKSIDQLKKINSKSNDFPFEIRFANLG
jgi:hypothetical protein